MESFNNHQLSQMGQEKSRSTSGNRIDVAKSLSDGPNGA
jgi:hypothetical protein